MLVKILKEPKKCILKQYQKLLELEEVKLEFEEEALHAIAAKAMEKENRRKSPPGDPGGIHAGHHVRDPQGRQHRNR